VTRYRGRFAPSPTGPLHRGSLVAALASHLDARAQGGEWLVRIEDVDVPRTVPGAADEILRCLEACGLEWDGAVVYQTTRFPAYESALSDLRRQGATYLCGCSRKEMDGGGIYPGTCRAGIPAGRAARMTRLRVPDKSTVTFNDLLFGLQTQDVALQVGDFPLFRADGIWAYQLAVAVDDAWQNVTHIVRGEDLLDSTARQILLQRLLGLEQPIYAHIPVVLAADGQKLSKQTLAPAVDRSQPSLALARALVFLGQPVPDGLGGAPVREILAHAIRHWKLGAAVH
jgi:glutamyl-Q tRNA(Asp) synthetase